MKAFTYADLETNDELYIHEVIVVDKGQSYIRIDKYLINRMERITRSRLQVGIENGNILVNDKPVKSNYKVKPNDMISVLLPYADEDRNFLAPEDIPLDIVHEDADILIVNKAPGMVVHPGVGNYTGTLVNAILHHFSLEQLPILKGNPMDRPGLVHRIDKDTSGLLVIAKNDHAMAFLANQFFHHTIEREYYALVWGDVKEDRGTVVGNIGRNPHDRMQMKVFADGEEGKFAVTHYEVVERFYYVTLIKCRLETGRTHQIRVHMKYIGHTLFNDKRYGGDQILKGTVYSKYKQFVENCFNLIPRQALHAKSLGFIHPTTGEKIVFESELPDDFTAVLDKWRKYINSRKEMPIDDE